MSSLGLALISLEVSLCVYLLHVLVMATTNPMRYAEEWATAVGAVATDCIGTCASEVLLTGLKSVLLAFIDFFLPPSFVTSLSLSVLCDSWNLIGPELASLAFFIAPNFGPADFEYGENGCTVLSRVLREPNLIGCLLAYSVT